MAGRGPLPAQAEKSNKMIDLSAPAAAATLLLGKIDERGRTYGDAKRGDRGAEGGAAAAVPPGGAVAVDGHAFDPLRVRGAAAALRAQGGHAHDLLGKRNRVHAEARAG